MASIYRIILEGPRSGVSPDFRSLTLAQEAVDLTWTANELGVRPLTEFCGPGFFSAADGMRSVQALIREISALLGVSSWRPDVVADLQTCEQILGAALDNEIRWRFDIEKESAQHA